jgi:hypothetical protein
MILHPITFQFSKRYGVPQTSRRSREVAQIGTVDSVSSMGKMSSEGYTLLPLVLSTPIWLAEVQRVPLPRLPLIFPSDI